MAQHDYVIANGTGAAVRSDLNNALAAIVSQNSGATEPATMYAYQWWADTTTGLLKLRNGANNAWITLRELDGTLTIEAGTVSAPGLAFASDLNTGVWSPGADQFAIATNGVERVEWGTSEVVFNDGGTNYDFRIEGDTNANLFFVDASAEAVGIGTTSPTGRLDVTDSSKIYYNVATSSPYIGFTNSTAAAYADGRLDGSSLQFLISGGERARIDSSGRLLVGTSSARSNFFAGAATAQLQVEGIDSEKAALASINTANTVGAARIYLAKARGGSVGSTTIVQNGDALGQITLQGSDGTNFIAAAEIRADVDGTPGANDMPGRLVFSTTADGASSPTERMRISSGGTIDIGQNGGSLTAGGAYIAASGQAYFGQAASDVLVLNRRTNDGNIVSFRQDGAEEGTISVSGSTVSYNGAHLSRWSQLPGGAERTEILRGSVLSNLDEMCEWGEEDNEQLNRMKVSDVEGDKNVSGVFQAWDDDDDTYTDDFYCAMTGDFIIRIAEGVTVERGDLLMSAGDGTAKPQDDDIIRSKTIAKVTSTNVSCTYEDGSYCVPCVLMAC